MANQSIAPRTFGEGEDIRAIPTMRMTEIMLELLKLKPTDKLLEIGTGSGTQTAEWAKHCKEVHSVELKPYNFADYMGNHVYVRAGDGAKGIPEEAPFDAIIVTCGVKELPAQWQLQLAEGGRLVVPIGDAECQRVTLFIKLHGVLGACKIGCYARFMMMEEGHDKEQSRRIQ